MAIPAPYMGNIPQPNLGPMQPLGSSSPAIDPSSIAPVQRPSGGMFGGIGRVIRSSGINPGDVVSAFLAGMYPRYADAFEGPMMQRQRIQGEMQAQANLQNMEFQRQLALLPYQMQMRMYENPLAQTLLAQGVQPGTAQWNTAMATQQTNLLDPVVNAGPYGPVLRSQVASAANAKPTPTPAAISALRANPSLASQFDEQFGAGASAGILGNGGQTPPASGTFQ